MHASILIKFYYCRHQNYSWRSHHCLYLDKELNVGAYDNTDMVVQELVAFWGLLIYESFTICRRSLHWAAKITNGTYMDALLSCEDDNALKIDKGWQVNEEQQMYLPEACNAT